MLFVRFDVDWLLIVCAGYDQVLGWLRTRVLRKRARERDERWDDFLSTSVLRDLIPLSTVCLPLYEAKDNHPLRQRISASGVPQTRSCFR